MAINIYLVEDHEIVRRGMEALLGDESGVKVVGQSSNCNDLFTNIKKPLPGMVLFDLHAPTQDGLDCTRRIRRDFPAVKILVLSGTENSETVVEMLDAGADGYLLKNSSKDELMYAIRKVAGGGLYIAPEFTLSLLNQFKATGGVTVRKSPQVPLTEREMDVLRLIAEGKTNAEIAKQLFTSVRTIETRRKRLLEKTGTNNTATLMKFVIKNDIIR